MVKRCTTVGEQQHAAHSACATKVDSAATRLVGQLQDRIEALQGAVTAVVSYAAMQWPLRHNQS